MGTKNRFFTVKLIGKSKGNVEAIGATVVLELKNGHKQVHEYYSAQMRSDRYGQKESRIIFGIGKQKVKKVTVRWPFYIDEDGNRINDVLDVDYKDIKRGYKMKSPFIIHQT